MEYIYHGMLWIYTTINPCALEVICTKLPLYLWYWGATISHGPNMLTWGFKGLKHVSATYNNNGCVNMYTTCGQHTS